MLGILVAALLAAPPLAPSAVVHLAAPGACKDGIIHAPAGPFAVWLFCEDALANHIGVVYADHMTLPRAGAWSISDRFWQQRIWATDVRSIAWSEDGSQLFVSTGAAYGSSGLYQLDLLDRRAYKLMAEFPGHDVEILVVDAPSVRYQITDINTGTARVRRVQVKSRRSR